MQQLGGSVTAGHTSDEDTPLTADEMYDLLSNRRRRFVLSYLLRNPSVPLRDLSAELAAWENDISVTAVTSKQRKRIYTALHQTHLIRLDKFDVVEYDRSRGTITATPRLDMFEPHLVRNHGTNRPWHRLYGGLAGVGVAVSLGVMLGLPGAERLLPGTLGLLLGGAVLTLSFLQAGADEPTASTAVDAESREFQQTGLAVD